MKKTVVKLFATLTGIAAAVVASASFVATAPTASSPPPPPPPPAATDFDSRASGSNVVWWHNYDDADEVDAFRWTSAYSSGNDPDDAGTSRDQDTVEWSSSGGYDDGPYLILSRNTGTGEGKDWWRPFSPMDTGNGKAAADPGAAGNISASTWSPTDGGNQTSTWSGGYYGPRSEDVGSHEGYEFYLQLAMRLDQDRINAGVSGGKIQYLTRTERSLSAQELVTYYKNSTTFSIYRAGSPEVPSDISLSSHVAGEWIHYLYRIIPGDEETSNTQIDVWRVRTENSETTYTKIFSQDGAYTDYQDADTPKSWNAVILSTYTNGLNVGEFTQEYDEVIFSKDWIVEPGISEDTELYQACLALDSGESATFTTGDSPGISETEFEWQTNGFHDPMRHRVHFLGKAAGFSSAWVHEYYDIINDTWVEVTSSLTGVAQFGHIYGNTGFNWFTGELFQVAGGVNTASNRDLFGYDPDDGSNGTWSEVVSNFDSSGNWNDTANGLAVHPRLYGPGEPGVVVGNQISNVFIKLSDDSDEDTGHSSNTYGQKEGVGLYWPYYDAVVLGGSTGNALAWIEPNGGSTPSTTTLSDPPITTSGQSRGTDGSLNTGFGSVIVHPDNPAKLLLFETAGSRVWEGTWTGTDISWSSATNHPFTNPGNTPRVIASLRGIPCVWAVGNDGSSFFSKLYRPAR